MELKEIKMLIALGNPGEKYENTLSNFVVIVLVNDNYFIGE